MPGLREKGPLSTSWNLENKFEKHMQHTKSHGHLVRKVHRSRGLISHLQYMTWVAIDEAMKALVPVRSVSLWLLVTAVKKNPTRFMPVQTRADVTRAFPAKALKTFMPAYQMTILPVTACYCDNACHCDNLAEAKHACRGLYILEAARSKASVVLQQWRILSLPVACQNSLNASLPTGEVAPNKEGAAAASATEAIIVTPAATLGADDAKPRLQRQVHAGAQVSSAGLSLHC